MVTLSVDDHFLSAYLFYGAILMLKTWVMSFVTARHRIANKAFPSPEDYRRRPVPINADVERVRRAHLNDLENIPIFMITAWLYMFSGMPVSWGIWCLRVFTAARVFHTIVYLNAFSYPRAVSFAVGACCTAFMAICVLYSVI
nr:microsomal glutathione S-transferase 1-like [Pocillopora verrucosa]